MGIIYFVIFAVLFIITLQNYYVLSQPVSLKFFHITLMGIPMGIWILAAFGIGYLIGYVRSIPAKVKEFSKSREISKLRKRLTEFEQKLQTKPEPYTDASEKIVSSPALNTENKLAPKREEEKLEEAKLKAIEELKLIENEQSEPRVKEEQKKEN